MCEGVKNQYFPTTALDVHEKNVFNIRNVILIINIVGFQIFSYYNIRYIIYTYLIV